jgi:transcriptional antiterminator RfaH
MDNESWFCLRSHPKHEHIAAAELRQWDGVQIFCPRIRFRRKTKSGAVWVTEALFPNYLFARFDPQSLLCGVRSARGVRCIVHFGEKYPMVPATAIEELRQSVGKDEMETVSPILRIGDRVTITGGALHGLQSIIHCIMPAKQRVGVLLEFLGQTTMVELNASSVIREHVHPLAV